MYKDYRINEISIKKPDNISLDDYHKEKYDLFTKEFIKTAFSGIKDENALFSVANIYLVLNMLTEITAGTSQNQILQALHSLNDSSGEIRSISQEIGNSFYKENDECKSNIANSLWITKDISCDKNAISNVSDHMCDIFAGEFNNSDYISAIKHWLNDKTGNMLKESIDNIDFNSQTAAALISTLFLSCAWYEQFPKENTTDKTFYGTVKNSLIPFMHMTSPMEIFYCDGGACIAKGLSNNGNMWFILPNEEQDIEELIQKGDFIKIITKPNDWQNVSSCKVSMSIPQMDVSCDNDLISLLKTMGICDIFDISKADFSPLDKKNSLFINKALQSFRLTLDENGIRAASYTVMGISRCSLLPEEIIEFNLTRPFILTLTNEDNVVLFAGIINNL